MKRGHPDLPCIAGTLLQTDREVVTSVKSGTDYYYFGLIDQLQKYLDIHIPNVSSENLVEINYH